MANEKQLSILQQGVESWNKWRLKNSVVRPDLSQAFLHKAELMGAEFIGVNLSGADLREANLFGSNLSVADLSNAKLSGANLNRSILLRANLSSADLSNASFAGAQISFAMFIAVDFRQALGLDRVDHMGPSSIGTDTLQKSQGKIPNVFLKGCGLSDWEIEMAKLYNPDLNNEQRNQILYRVYDLQSSQAIQISPLFISYSHGDSEFVNKIGHSLTKKSVRYWRDIHDLKAGRIERQIDQAISHDRTVLLVLSENSLKSDWVEHEVRTAREIAKNAGRDTLCPVALDDSWKKSPWPARVMEQVMEYNILDFSEWKDNSKFDVMFRKLIDGLELFYKG